MAYHFLFLHNESDSQVANPAHSDFHKCSHTCVTSHAFQRKLQAALQVSWTLFLHRKIKGRMSPPRILGTTPDCCLLFRHLGQVIKPLWGSIFSYPKWG
jgi:hypothetical protein